MASRPAQHPLIGDKENRRKGLVFYIETRLFLVHAFDPVTVAVPAFIPVHVPVPGHSQ